MKKFIYGLDLSLECTGVTIFDLELLEPVCITSISTDHFKKNIHHGTKLKYIEDKFLELIEQYPPHEIAIERGFSRFPTSTQVIYRVHGIANKVFHEYKQIYYPPKTIKEAICRGDATKKYVQETINKKYPHIIFKNEDESDSFAIVLTYLIKNNIIEWEKPFQNRRKK